MELMTINAVVIGVGIMTENATATAAVESVIIVTGIENGMTSPSYASGGQRAEAKIRAAVMTERGGRSGGVTIVGGTMAGAGIASGSVTGKAIGNQHTNSSVGQAGMVEALEVLSTEEGMHDDILAGCAYWYTLCILIHHHRPYGSGLSSRPNCLRYEKDYSTLYNKFDTQTRKRHAFIYLSQVSSFSIPRPHRSVRHQTAYVGIWIGHMNRLRRCRCRPRRYVWYKLPKAG